MKKVLVSISLIGLGLLLAWAFSEDSSQLKAELQDLKTELQQLKTDIGKTENERDELKVKIAVEQRNREQLQEQVNELTGSREKLQRQVEEFTFSRDQSQQQLAEIIVTRDNLKKQLIEVTASRNRLSRQVDELTRSRDTAVTRAKTAQERVDILMAMLNAGKKESGGQQDQDGLTATNQAKAKEDTEPPIIEVSKDPDVLTDISWPAVVPSRVDGRPVCQSFNTTRPRIMPGQSSTLSWQVSNAERVRIEPGIGPVSALGARAVNPSKTTTYTLIATNKAGQSKLSCRVEISERITIFSTDAIHPRVLLEEDRSSGDRKVLPGQKLPAGDPNATLGKFIGYRARTDESGKFIFIPVYENKKQE